MVEVFPKVSVYGLSPITASYTFKFIYGVGRHFEDADYIGYSGYGTLNIPSSDMNLISPPGNAPLRVTYIDRWNTSNSYGGTVEVNDFIHQAK
jgi:hypothetical protein